jgi:hypothetical protein
MAYSHILPCEIFFNKLFYIFNKIIKTSIYFIFFNFYKITEKEQLISGERITNFQRE